METLEYDSDEDGFVGNGTTVLRDFASTDYRIQLSEEDEDINEDFENEKIIEEIDGISDIDKDIKIKYQKKLFEEMNWIGQKIFLEAFLDFGVDKNPFYQETRDFPVFYPYSINQRNVVTLKLPEGYNLESAPEPTRMSLPGNKASFTYHVRPLGEKIVIDYVFKVNSDYFIPSEYAALKKFYDLVISKGKEMIVLAKA